MAVLLSALQVLPTLAELPYTYRAEASPLAGRGAIDFSPILELIDPAGETLLPFVPFLGLFTGFLALAGLLLRPRTALPLGGIALIFAVLVAGDQTPVQAWIQRIPGLSLFRTPSKLYGVTAVLMILLSALGAHAIWLRVSRHRVLAAVFVAVPLLSLLEYAASIPRTAAFLDRTRSYPTPLFETLDGFESALPHLDRTGAPARVSVTGDPYRLGNLPSIYPGINVFPALGPPLLGQAYFESKLAPSGTGPRRFNDLGVEWVFLPGECQQFPSGLVEVESSGPGYCLYRNPDAPERYRVLGNGVLVESDEEMFERVAIFPNPGTPIVAPRGLIPRFQKATRPDGEVELESYAANRIALETTAPVDSMLLVRESWSAGWQAEVDDTPTPIHRAAGIFFAVPVPEGTHQVELRYVPPGLAGGLACAALWLAVSATILLWPRFSKAGNFGPADRER